MLAVTGFTWVVMTFFSVAFIALLQQLMHWIDWDVEETVTWPWRHELAYTAFLAVTTTVILSMVDVLPLHTVGLILTNCVLLIMTTYNNVIMTLRNKLLATGWTFALISVHFGTISWTVTLLFIGYALLLWLEQLRFVPFDTHPVVTILVQVYLGAGFWVLADPTYRLQGNLLVLLVSFGLSVVACYVFTVLLHNDHVSSMDSARNARTDGLTGARNWMSFRDDTLQLFQSGTPYVIIALDIDHFKQINDTYGHLVGNRTLVSFSSTMQMLLSDVDARARLYRTGGEEFMVVLPETTLATARGLAERCQFAIRQLQIRTDDGQVVRITASLGISATVPGDERANAVFRRADGQLYRAKQGGRDRIVGGR
ncbi:GGDEF domain-containing protein [Lacticaseibacillus thailandensis]|uniref:GGDEF domain-containing protein n=1 Tax=Lacticaseibacillus thailandensis DSM 22698 = JCM 13996 TaxID=1423810 RepID=A0A0R2C6M7_9LACO|nr:GGDEF domain-containing protein [Lacticaseibacillus thailandensis]KRM87405.1 hypothetical protein FD19_GL000908 [Lacticaseibacillus thailandensis DSM 22698 = JCM 13996]